MCGPQLFTSDLQAVHSCCLFVPEIMESPGADPLGPLLILLSFQTAFPSTSNFLASLYHTAASRHSGIHATLGQFNNDQK